MGKYDEVSDGLPRLLDKEVERMENFKERAEKYRGMSAVALAMKWVDRREEAAELDKQLSDLNREIEVLRVLFIRAAEADGIDGVSLASGRKVSLGTEPYASVDNPEEFRQWCHENGLERSLTLPWQTTNAITKDRLLTGHPPPPGIKVYLREKLRLTTK